MGPTHLVLLDVKHSGALLDVKDSKTMFDINLSSLMSSALKVISLTLFYLTLRKSRWVGPITMPLPVSWHTFFSSFWDGSRTKRREEIAQKRKRRGSNKWPLTLYPPWSQKSSTLLTLAGIFFSSFLTYFDDQLLCSTSVGNMLVLASSLSS